MPHCIYIVEDHPAVREAYTLLFELEDDFEVCGAAETAEKALDDLANVRPDLLLVDVRLPGMSGLELVERLRHTEAPPPALIVSGHEKEVYGAAAQRAGARGFVMKTGGPDELLEAVRRVLGGGVYFGEGAGGG